MPDKPSGSQSSAKSRSSRIPPILGSAVFLLLAPGTIAGLLPWLISHWKMQAPLLGFTPFRALGGVLIVAGLLVLLESFARFALRGLGTPAPVFPTQQLIVSGLYRYVRNPMYVAVLCINLGQGLLLGNLDVLIYAAIVWLGMHLFVVGYEEPTLRRRYGAEFDFFCRNVPRWIPRLTPWRVVSGSAEPSRIP
jgi:protein-S-isoprenylcysteine O-methyltransferase Ste14